MDSVTRCPTRRTQTVRSTIKDVIADICNNYCRYSVGSKPCYLLSDYMDSFHVRLKNERKKICKSQTKFAEEYGFNPHTYPKWESGLLAPSIRDLITLCNIFGCDADYLLGRQEERARDEMLDEQCGDCPLNRL